MSILLLLLLIGVEGIIIDTYIKCFNILNFFDQAIPTEGFYNNDIIREWSFVSNNNTVLKNKTKLLCF